MELYYVFFLLLVANGCTFALQGTHNRNFTDDGTIYENLSHIKTGFADISSDYSYMTDSLARRIFNGIRPKINEAPYMAVIFADNSFKEYPFATGVIISSSWILTTAKTLRIQQGKRLKVLTGMDDIYDKEQHFNEVERVTLHSNYNLNEVYNDIALVKVKREIIFNEKQNTIPLMLSHEFAYYQLRYNNRMNLTVYNYGSHDPTLKGILKRNVVSVNTEVVDFTERIFISAQRTIPTCYGDTGSPAIVDGKLVGLLIIEYGCGRDYPNVFIGISHYNEWISNAIN